MQTQTEPLSSRRISPSGLFWLKAVLLILAGFWALAPVWHGPWLWDDDLYITQNLLLRSASGLGKIWFAAPGVNYFPITSTVQWLQWHGWGSDPAGYHATNIVLHVLSAFLLWRLLDKLGVRFAYLGGLLFAVHPLAVESVGWVSELKNTLSLPFLLGAMIAWVEWDEGRDGRPARPDLTENQSGTRTGGPPVPTYYVLAVGLFLAAMLCKSTVVMFPVVLLLYAWWRRGKIGAADLKASAAFFALSLGLGLVTVWFEHHRAMGGLMPAPGPGLFSRIAAAGPALFFYLSQCLVPHGLVLVYPHSIAETSRLLQLAAWLLLVAGFGFLWVKRARWGRHALFGFGFFALNLVPVLGVIPMSYQRISWVADHFAYLPLIGLIGLAVAALGAWAERGLASKRIAWALALVVVAAFAVESHSYATTFSSAERLWTYTVERNPESSLAQNDLGLVLSEQGRWPEAIAHYKEALRLKPDSAEIEGNLGLALADAGRPDEAIDHYEAALRLSPGLPEAHNNLGLALRQMGRTSEAIDHLEEAVRLRPDYIEARNNLGNTLLQAGRLPEAIGQYQELLRLDPGLAQVHNNLGLALARSGRMDEAIDQFEQAVRLEPGFAGAHHNLGVVLRTVGRNEEGRAQLEEAARLQTTPR